VTPRLTAPRVEGFDGLAAVEPVRLRMWDGAPGWPTTEVRLGTEGRILRVEFHCAFEELSVDPTLPLDAPAPRLWEWDVVELFLSDRSEALPYREIEASPLGQWLALSFDLPRVASARPWGYRPEVSAAISPGLFTVRLGIDLGAAAFGAGASTPGATWRVGLFRIAERPPDRRHLSLAPGGTAAPDFHRPGSWAHLALER
jgi:hypothetical protein